MPNLRVVAYCRVSTKHGERQSSLAVQEDYYDTYIRNHTNRELTGINADQGTGHRTRTCALLTISV